MRHLSRTILFVSAIMLLTIGALPVAAQLGDIKEGEADQLGLKTGEPRDYLLGVTAVLLTVVTVVAVLVLIVGGVMYIISLGDEKKTAQAKQIIMYTIIGLIVIGLAAILVNFTLKAITRGGAGPAGQPQPAGPGGAPFGQPGGQIGPPPRPQGVPAGI